MSRLDQLRAAVTTRGGLWSTTRVIAAIDRTIPRAEARDLLDQLTSEGLLSRVGGLWMPFAAADHPDTYDEPEDTE